MKKKTGKTSRASIGSANAINQEASPLKPKVPARTEARDEAGRDLAAAPALRPIGISLQAVALRGLQYREITQVTPASPAPAPTTSMEIAINLQGQINVYSQLDSDRNVVEVLLTASIRPDPSVRPIELDATLAGLFVPSDGMPLEDLVRFANEAGGRLLFPYLRELVSAATSRGIFGPLFLDPVQVNALVPEEQLKSILKAPRSAR